MQQSHHVDWAWKFKYTLYIMYWATFLQTEVLPNKIVIKGGYTFGNYSKK